MFKFRPFVKPLSAVLAILMLAVAAPAWADNSPSFQQAMAAHKAGNYKQAFRLLQPLAQQGDAEAQYHLCVMYFEGHGVARNYQQAFAWCQKAANQEFAAA